MRMAWHARGQGFNPLSSTRHNASSTSALSVVCQQMTQSGHSTLRVTECWSVRTSPRLDGRVAPARCDMVRRPSLDGGPVHVTGPYTAWAAHIADAKRFQLEDVVRIGPDVRLTATPLS